MSTCLQVWSVRFNDRNGKHLDKDKLNRYHMCLVTHCTSWHRHERTQKAERSESLVWLWNLAITSICTHSHMHTEHIESFRQCNWVILFLPWLIIMLGMPKIHTALPSVIEVITIFSLDASQSDLRQFLRNRERGLEFLSNRLWFLQDGSCFSHSQAHISPFTRIHHPWIALLRSVSVPGSKIQGRTLGSQSQSYILELSYELSLCLKPTTFMFSEQTNELSKQNYLIVKLRLNVYLCSRKIPIT